MGSTRTQPGVEKMISTHTSSEVETKVTGVHPRKPPRPSRPAGEQAIGSQLYALIRQAIAELAR